MTAEEIAPARMAALRALGGQPGARERIALTTAAADRLFAVKDYGLAAVEAAQRDIMDAFRVAVRRQGAGDLSEAEIEAVTLAMANRMLTRFIAMARQENDRLRDEIVALGGVPVAGDAPTPKL